jgi:hypothetical protein
MLGSREELECVAVQQRLVIKIDRPGRVTQRWVTSHTDWLEDNACLNESPRIHKLFGNCRQRQKSCLCRLRTGQTTESYQHRDVWLKEYRGCKSNVRVELFVVGPTTVSENRRSLRSRPVRESQTAESFPDVRATSRKDLASSWLYLPQFRTKWLTQRRCLPLRRRQTLPNDPSFRNAENMHAVCEKLADLRGRDSPDRCRVVGLRRGTISSSQLAVTTLYQ